jgi:hypothetical protein
MQPNENCLKLFGFFVHGVLAAPLAVLLEFQFALDKLFVLAGMVINALARLALYTQQVFPKL